MLPLTLEDVARFPRPGYALPGRITFSPDGEYLCFLWSPAGDLTRELYQIDLKTGVRSRRIGVADVAGGAEEGALTEAEALRRERERLREVGITHYHWADQAPVLLIPLRGDLWIFSDGPGRKVAENATDARLSRDGQQVVFVRNGDLYTVPSAGGPEQRLTHLAQEGVSAGLAEYIAQEEMARMDGFWISPSGQAIAFLQVDERHIPRLHIPLMARAPGAEEVHRYPFTGAENARVHLGIVGLKGELRWIDIGPNEYVCRVAWQNDSHLWVQVQGRDQRRLELRRIDLENNTVQTVLTEQAESWVNLHHDFRLFADGGFLWSSERSGFRHLYRYDRDGQLLSTLTQGDWAVDRVLKVTKNHVYFMGSMQTPLERHAYRVALSNGQIETLSQGAGMHEFILSPYNDNFVDVYEHRAQAPTLTLYRPQQPPLLIHSSVVPAFPAPELLSFTNREGTRLYGALFRPAGTGPWPLVVAVYGGPHVQAVQESWALTMELRAQYLASQGIAVLKVDNRGSARRGLVFESAIYRNMGDKEVQDQVDGVNYCISQGIADPKRVGIYGWSYGGYMSLMCLLRAPEVFKAAVAGAPVTEWEGYDTHYTERYMALPKENPEGYQAASVLSHVGNLKGQLVLVHGMIDENVHFRHTARLIDQLSKKNLPYTLIAFPDERHMPRGFAERLALESRIVDFFKQNL